MADASPVRVVASPSPSSDYGDRRELAFAEPHSQVDVGFWHRLAALKLDSLRTDDSPIPINGYYSPCSDVRISNRLRLLAESLPSHPIEQSKGLANPRDRNKCPVPGTLLNTNNLQGFRNLDRESLLRAELKKILNDINSGNVEDDPALLLRFLVISYADLKKWIFHYRFAFPVVALDPSPTLLSLCPASKALTAEETASLLTACNEWRNSGQTTDVPFFLVSITANARVSLRHLKDWEALKSSGEKVLFGYYDPSNLPNATGWPLQNLLAFVRLRLKMNRVEFFCYREKRGAPDLDFSLIGEASISVSDGDWSKADLIPRPLKWEEKEGKRGSEDRSINLAESMDPVRLTMSAAELNLKLMKWRSLPSLNLDKLSGASCLLLGVGTLGSEVARLLLAWGIRKLTLVDSGRVSMSNPVRQSLYNFEDCLNGGELKAVAAARNLKAIFPAVDVEGISMEIPMPGHPVPASETAAVLESCNRLQRLIKENDAAFLLTDTRESRWLPTLLCAHENKIAITAALGFDSYLVMRHGAGTSSGSNGCGEGSPRLGCYFCSDVVAPVDSVSNRTLDQQCTVTRPGLAPIASALAVELLVAILHHPLGMFAPGELASSIVAGTEQPLGILPHQIRGTLPQCALLTLIGHSSSSCTACSDAVVSEFRKRGLEFILEAINHPTCLEDLTGLTELMQSARAFQLELDDDAEESEEEII